MKMHNINIHIQIYIVTNTLIHNTYDVDTTNIQMTHLHGNSPRLGL